MDFPQQNVQRVLKSAQFSEFPELIFRKRWILAGSSLFARLTRQRISKKSL